MDMMELRFRMMAMIGGNKSVWKQKEITAPSNMTKAGEVRPWLENEVPSGNLYVFAVINDYNEKVQNRFVSAQFVNGSGLYYTRIRTGNTPPYQQRNMTTDTEDVIVYQGDKITIFYQ